MAGHSPSRDGRLATPYVPAIHAAIQRMMSGIVTRGSAWMPGTRPGMTSLPLRRPEQNPFANPDSAVANGLRGRRRVSIVRRLAPT
jgi:hypothetical protein